MKSSDPKIAHVAMSLKLIYSYLLFVKEYVNCTQKQN